MIEKRPKEVRTVGGLVLAAEAAGRSLNEGVVIAIGKGKRTSDGKFLPMGVKVGDNVLLGEGAGTDVKMNGKEYSIMREDEILGILEDTDQPLKMDTSSNFPNVKDLPK